MPPVTRIRNLIPRQMPVFGLLCVRVCVCVRTCLELLELLQDHVVRHVVKKAVRSGEDDVTKLDVKRRLVRHFGTEERRERERG